MTQSHVTLVSGDGPRLISSFFCNYEALLRREGKGIFRALTLSKWLGSHYITSSEHRRRNLVNYRVPSPTILIDLIPHMSKKFKSQASSSRAAAGGFVSIGGFSSGFGNSGREPSTLTYIAEPPDLSRIPDQQLVVAFKNLLRKDEITRTKALDELREYTSTVSRRGGTLDDGLLEAWVCTPIESTLAVN